MTRAAGIKIGLKIIKRGVARATPMRVARRVTPARKRSEAPKGRRVARARMWEEERSLVAETSWWSCW